MSVHPIQVKCSTCKAEPGEGCRYLGTTAARGFHAERVTAANARPADPRQLSILDLGD